MPLLSLREISLDFGGPKIFDDIELHIEEKERIALIGRNGEGKSTLLKLVAGELEADVGYRELPQGTKLAYLTQDVPINLQGSVYDIVASGVPERFETLKNYHDAQIQIAENPSSANMQTFEKAQVALEAADGWALEQQIETLLSQLMMRPEARFEDLSGGKKRRVLLARALVQNPHILILDEPTNHLDIASIDFLESLLKAYTGTVLFVTHDRRFMQNLATRIIELDRGSLSSWPGDYENYLRRLEERENAESLETSRFDKKLAEEEAWVRQGIKARRKRNEGRVRALKEMRETAEGRRKKQGTARINVLEAAESGRVVARLRNIHYSWGDVPFVENFSLKVMRGEKIGILGPNGCGKSTLINLILGRLEPDSGSVKMAQNLEVAYADQLRSALALERTVIDNIADGAKNVIIDGREVDVMAYLASFMFKADRMRQPVSSLSGGERNRLLLAKLFTKKANLMVLDEPTNDLDIETLEVLEEKLVNYSGTLLVVSHDRDFLDHIATRTLVFEGHAQIGAYVGGYHDWLDMLERTGKPNPLLEANRLQSRKHSETVEAAPKTECAEPTEPGKKSVKKKLSYKEQRELDMLPEQMEKIEAQMETIQAELADPALYKNSPEKAADLGAQLKVLEDDLVAAFERWETLECC